MHVVSFILVQKCILLEICEGNEDCKERIAFLCIIPTDAFYRLNQAPTPIPTRNLFI